MVKKTISFTLIIILFLMVYQFLFTMVKDNHYVTYSIDKGEIFTIDETYKKDGDNDYYLIKVTNNDKNFIFKLKNDFNKQKNIIEDINIFEKDDFYCIGLDLVGKDKYSYPECIKDNVLYEYNMIKDQIDLNEYTSKLKNKESEKYETESIKYNEHGFNVNKSYLDDNEIIMIYDYNRVLLYYPTFSRSFIFSNVDYYKNTHGILVGKYYLVPKTTTLPAFNTIIKYDVVDGVKEELALPVEISKQSYLNGVHDNKLYLFDNSNKRQFEIDPYSNDITIIGNVDDEGVTFVNGEEQSISVYDLDKEEVKFQEKVDEYSNLNYDSIFINDYFAIYVKDGNFYKVYHDYIDIPILLFYEPDAKNVIVKGENIYFIKESSLYKYNEYGIHEMVTRGEFLYNYENMYDIYLKK